MTPNRPGILARLKATRRRPSAVIALGALSGLLAGLMMMTISIPLVALTFTQQEQAALARTVAAAENIERWLVAGSVLTPAKVTPLGTPAVEVSLQGSGDHVFSVSPGPELSALCARDNPTQLVQLRRTAWAITCVDTPGHHIVVGSAPNYASGRDILYLTFTLALVVGLVTALGQARLLQPLSEMALALERVGRGERRERVASTGLMEFDVLVDRINEAAENVEERVDAITARITVVQEMARVVAHEVRNPLQSLELLTTLVAMEEDPEERKQLAESIHEEIRTLDQVVHRLLREGSGMGALRLRRRPERIADLVEQAAAIHRPAASRRGVQLAVGVVTHVEVAVDAAMLGRCIQNLVTNALDAAPDQTGEIRLSVFQDRDYIAIACDDNGPGVPEHLKDTLFDANVTGRDTGHGLGLALVKAVLVAHGGSIEHAVSPLGGARFLARIPLDPAESTDA